MQCHVSKNMRQSSRMQVHSCIAHDVTAQHASLTLTLQKGAHEAVPTCCQNMQLQCLAKQQLQAPA
jgi:hypothetical protein